MDVKWVISSLISNRNLGDSIDKERIGIIGHSAGGYTALAVVGGVPNLRSYSNHCNDHHDDPLYCAGHKYLPENIKNGLNESTKYIWFEGRACQSCCFTGAGGYTFRAK